MNAVAAVATVAALQTEVAPMEAVEAEALSIDTLPIATLAGVDEDTDGRHDGESSSVPVARPVVDAEPSDGFSGNQAEIVSSLDLRPSLGLLQQPGAVKREEPMSTIGFRSALMIMQAKLRRLRRAEKLEGQMCEQPPPQSRQHYAGDVVGQHQTEGHPHGEGHLEPAQAAGEEQNVDQSQQKRSLPQSSSILGLDGMIEDRKVEGDLKSSVVRIEVPIGKPIEEVYDGVHDGPVLGSGISGLVRLITHKKTGVKYAVKCLDLGLVETEGLQQLREEIYVMCQLDHPNIVRLEEVYESLSEIYLVQELCLGGKLFDRLDEQPDYHYTEAQCARLVKQMLISVRYIHSRGIIHRDLKLENFLFSSTDPDSELKMIDFGLSKHFKFGEVQHEAVGMPYTVAPEVIRGCYDERCDVWAIGVIAFLLLSGDLPFGGGSEPLTQIRENILCGQFEFDPEDIWDNVSHQAKDFIKKLLVTDPNCRPTARETLKSTWLKEWGNKSRNIKDKALNPNVVKALMSFREYSDMCKLLCEVLSFTLLPDQIAGLRQEFENLDIDGSGVISLKGLKQVLMQKAGSRTLGALTEEEVEDIFNTMGVPKTETRLHWHKFIAAGLSQCKVDDLNLKLVFACLDANHKGYITVENMTDLLRDDPSQSEDAIRSMWGGSCNSVHTHITYEKFLLLMKGQKKPDTDVLGPSQFSLGSAAEGTPMPVLPLEPGEQPSVFKPDVRRAMLLPEHDHNDSETDETKKPLVVNRKFYQAHRQMRLAVVEASKRFKEQRMARTMKMLDGQNKMKHCGAGLTTRHGHIRDMSSGSPFVGGATPMYGGAATPEEGENQKKKEGQESEGLEEEEKGVRVLLCGHTARATLGEKDHLDSTVRKSNMIDRRISEEVPEDLRGEEEKEEIALGDPDKFAPLAILEEGENQTKGEGHEGEGMEEEEKGAGGGKGGVAPGAVGSAWFTDVEREIAKLRQEKEHLEETVRRRCLALLDGGEIRTSVGGGQVQAQLLSRNARSRHRSTTHTSAELDSFLREVHRELHDIRASLAAQPDQMVVNSEQFFIANRVLTRSEAFHLIEFVLILAGVEVSTSGTFTFDGKKYKVGCYCSRMFSGYKNVWKGRSEFKVNKVYNGAKPVSYWFEMNGLEYVYEKNIREAIRMTFAEELNVDSSPAGKGSAGASQRQQPTTALTQYEEEMTPLQRHMQEEGQEVLGDTEVVGGAIRSPPLPDLPMESLPGQQTVHSERQRTHNNGIMESLVSDRALPSVPEPASVSLAGSSSGRSRSKKIQGLIRAKLKLGGRSSRRAKKAEERIFSRSMPLLVPSPLPVPAPPSLSHGVAVYCVTVPGGVQPGATFPARAGRRVLTVQCPPGAGPGTKLQITVGNKEEPPLSQTRSIEGTGVSGPWEKMLVFQAVVPRNTQPGQVFRAHVEGKSILVPCPLNAAPGSSVLFRLPATLLSK